MLNKFIVLMAMIAFSLYGCGGGGGGGGGATATATATVTGQFIDSAVGGLSYTCSSGTSGVTDQNGEYTCNEGDSITFSLNGFVIGSANVGDIITPNTIALDNEQAVNIAQLLQTLDSDNDASNGITIAQYGTQYDALATMASDSVTFDQADFDSVVSLYVSETLVSETAAQTHLNDSIASYDFNKASIIAAFAGKTIYGAQSSPAYSETWVVAVDGLSASGSGVDANGAFSGTGTISYTDTSFTFTSNDPADAPTTFQVVAITDTYIQTTTGKIYYSQAEAYTDAMAEVFAGKTVYPEQSSPSYSADWAFDASGTTATVTGVDANGAYTDHMIVTYSGTTFTATNQDVGDADYGIPNTFTVLSITSNEVRVKDSSNTEFGIFYSESAAGDALIRVFLNPNNSVTVSKDLTSLETSFLPELLGSNTLIAQKGDGSTESLECYMHHYNAAANEHVLHCVSPSDGTDFYFGLSSSNTSVISFGKADNGTYWDTWWNPLTAGTTTITGTLLFVNNPVTFTVNVTLNAI